MQGKCVIGAVAVLLSLIVAVACSPTTTSSPSNAPTQTTQAPKKEPVLYTGKSCFNQMADMAARWQPDAAPFHMESGLNSESNGHDGKATVWRAMFASPSRGTYKTFTCSGSRLPAEPPIGVTSSAETMYAANVPQLIFQRFDLITDSDAAFALSQEKGGSQLLEKDPQQPIWYSLDRDPKLKQLVWVVTYGTSPKDSKGFCIVNASTGKFLRAGK